MRTQRADLLVDAMLKVFSAIELPLESIGERTRIRITEAALAVAGIKNSLGEAKSLDDGMFLTTRKIIDFENKYLGETVSPGSYDDIRRRHLLPLLTAGLVVNSASVATQATNNPTRAYAATPLFAALLRNFGTDGWKTALKDFREKCEELKTALARRMERESVPVPLPSGCDVVLSPGEHNVLQRDVVEKFLPRFGFGAEVLYIGDASDKFLYKNERRLSQLRFFALEHEELPDVVAYSASHNLLFLIEAVHSCGQMSEARVAKLKDKLAEVDATVVFVSAFENRKAFRRFAADIAWETEVWIVENPDHLIHFNGWKFLELHKPKEKHERPEGSVQDD